MSKRFYTPSTGQYVSQFVPDELPAELMIKGIEGKQKKYDAQADLNAKLQEYKIKALPGYDTEYAKQWTSQIEDFVANSSDKDLASPEYQRQYKEFINKFQKDEGLVAVGASYAEHEKAQAMIAELKKKGETEAAEEMQHYYNKRFGEYTKADGAGYTGDVQLDANLIGEGVDKYTETFKFFKDLQESGSENVGFLDEGISYKTGWTGISDPRVKDQAKRMFNDWISSAAGKQYGYLYDMQRGYGDFEINKLEPEKRKKYLEDRESWLFNQFIEVGRTAVHGKSTTNIDDAYNIREGRKYENQDANAIITGQLDGEIIKNPQLSWTEQINNINRTQEDINRQLWDIKNGKTVAPGKEQYLRRRLTELNTEKNLINKDRDSKYKSFYDQATKEFDNKETRDMLFNKKPLKVRTDKELEERKIAIKKLADQKFKNYLSNTAQVMEHTGVISVPKGKGSIANTEEQFIKNTGGAGYSFYDAATGKEITNTVRDLSTFELTGLTQGDYKGGQGKVGKITIKQQIPDPNDPTNLHKLKTIERSINVVAVSRDPNRQVSNISYANNYFKTANDLKQSGDFEAAVAAERQALRLLNPELSKTFDDAGKSSSFRSKPIRFETNSGVQVITKVNKLDDGTYDVTLMDDQGRVLAPTANFTDIEKAKQQILNVSLR